MANFTALISSLFGKEGASESDIDAFVRAEYGRDWQYAKSKWLETGNFPDYLRGYRG